MQKDVKSKVTDVEMYWTDDDIEKIQRKPNLYIQKYGTAGCNHLAREIIQNAIDEVIDVSSHGNNVHVIYDQSLDKLTVIDNGRGFPENKYPLDIFCTKLQSGSKSYRDQSGGTAGEFGIGSTLVNALSTLFHITSHREKEKYSHVIHFELGKKILDKKMDNKKGNHGSEITFIPNKKYLGKNAHIDIKGIYEWITSISCLLGSEQKKITILFEVWDGMDLLQKEKIVSKPFYHLLDGIVKKEVVDYVTISSKTKFMETTHVNTKPVERDVLLELSFTYDSVVNPDESTIVTSYCNYTNTSDGGTHVDTVDECICRFLQTETKKILTDREKDKVDILWQDVRTDLRLIINVNSNAQVQFVGNAKTKIGNDELIPVFKKMVNEGLKEFFDNHTTLLNSICKIVKSNAKARIEVNKAKSVSTKVKTNVFDDHMSKNFYPCNNRGKEYKELYLCEGQRSSIGSLNDGRNHDVQAIFGFRGFTANPYKRTINTIFENAEWREYCKRIHFDIRAQNIDDLYYDKIIISTDGDTDGDGIASGILAFHAKFAKSIIDAGKLYRVYPPLYNIEDKNKPYIRNKEEFISVYKDRIIKNYKLYSPKGDEYDKMQLEQFIYDTKDYLQELSRIADHYSINRNFVEVVGYNICMYMIHHYKIQTDNDLYKLFSPDDISSNKKKIKDMLQDNAFIRKLMNDIQKEFPEIILKGEKSLVGPIEGRYQVLDITYSLLMKFKPIILVFRDYGISIKYKENDDNIIPCTIGKMLESTVKYIPKIITRYKGLGEANWDQISETIMDPAKRILVQLTFDDVQRDLKIFDTLHGMTVEDRKSRKDMMKSYNISRDEIDS